MSDNIQIIVKVDNDLEKNNSYKRLRDAYIILALQFLITFFVVKFIRDHPKYYTLIQQYSVIPILLSFGLLFLIQLGNFSPLVKLMFFTLFSVCLGTMCIAVSNVIPDSILFSALKSTLALFVSLSIVGWTCYHFGINLSKLQFILLLGLIGLIIGTLFSSYTPQNARILFTFGIVIFSALIAVDTYNIMRGKEKDVISDALGLYLSVINLFQQLVGLKVSNSF
jgi:FtsH-binding integral membrane protein